MADAPTLLPPNATALERALEQEAARLDALDTTGLASIWNPATCPSALLPWLAWALGVETWRPDWSDPVKRAVIAATPLIKRRKGTAAAVKAAVASFGAALALREWWELTPPGPAHTFTVDLTVADAADDSLVASFAADVVAAITAVKPLRSHFTFNLGLQAKSTLALRGASRVAAYARLQLDVQEPA